MQVEPRGGVEIFERAKIARLLETFPPVQGLKNHIAISQTQCSAIFHFSGCKALEK